MKRIPATCIALFFISVLNISCFEGKLTGAKIVRSTTTSFVGPTPYPVLPSNPNNATRVSSNTANDPEPLDISTKYMINRLDSPEALCNDGTKPAYFFRRGTGQGANRWIIYLEGGGGCGSSDPTSPYFCGARIGTGLETSNGLPGNIIGSAGIFYSQRIYNPDFYSYNMVYVHYCSSDFWRGPGIAKRIDDRNANKWWFSGQKIVEALFKDLEQYRGFANATNVIISGTSAGGFGITANAKMIQSMYPSKDIALFIDAAWGVPAPRFSEADSNGNYAPSNIIDPQLIETSVDFTEMKLDQTCLDSFYCAPNERCISKKSWCMLPTFATRYMNIPFFVNHDQLDRVLGVLGYNFDLCSYRDRIKYDPWLNDLTALNDESFQRPQAYFQTRSGIHGMLNTANFYTYSVTNGSASRKLKDIFGAWYFSRGAIPTMWKEPVSGTLSPDGEARAKGTCPL